MLFLSPRASIQPQTSTAANPGGEPIVRANLHWFARTFSFLGSRESPRGDHTNPQRKQGIQREEAVPRLRCGLVLAL